MTTAGNAAKDLAYVLQRVMVKRRQMSRLELAVERIEAWRGLPDRGNGERGGSSNLRSREDAAEAFRTILQADEDAVSVHDFVKSVGDLYQLVCRYTETVDVSMVENEPQCTSHARADIQAVAVFSKAYNLCRWCYDHAQAAARERGMESIEPQDWPPPKACRIQDSQGPTAAGRWLARHLRQNA
jgi:hypothetical protein